MYYKYIAKYCALSGISPGGYCTCSRTLSWEGWGHLEESSATTNNQLYSAEAKTKLKSLVQSQRQLLIGLGTYNYLY